jgi:hypothetical protein
MVPETTLLARYDAFPVIRCNRKTERGGLRSPGAITLGVPGMFLRIDAIHLNLGERAGRITIMQRVFVAVVLVVLEQVLEVRFCHERGHKGPGGPLRAKAQHAGAGDHDQRIGAVGARFGPGTRYNAWPVRTEGANGCTPREFQ